MTPPGSEPQSVAPDGTGSGGIDLTKLEQVLRNVGCPGERCREMAVQLDRRARQLAERQGRTYEEALAHLLSLMRQGWSAQERGF